MNSPFTTKNDLKNRVVTKRADLQSALYVINYLQPFSSKLRMEAITIL